MNHFRVGVAAAALVFAALPAARAEEPGGHAKAKAKAPERVPAPQLKDLAFLSGSWQCTGKTEGAAAAPFTTKIEVKLDLESFWYAFDYSRKGEGQPLTLRGWMGYTAIDKKYPFVTFNTYGGVVMLSSPGPEGDKLVFTGAAVGIDSVPTRYTFTRNGDKAFVGRLEGQGDGGAWIAIYEEHCKRTGK
jgi:hypothetical protein